MLPSPRFVAENGGQGHCRQGGRHPQGPRTFLGGQVLPRGPCLQETPRKQSGNEPRKAPYFEDSKGLPTHFFILCWEEAEMRPDLHLWCDSENPEACGPRGHTLGQPVGPREV